MASDSQKFDLLVYAGPGSLGRPDNVAFMNATKLVFFEPDPERYGLLSAKLKGRAGVELREQALSGVTGRVRLGSYNDSEMNSLHKPTGLLQFLPGLRNVGYIDAECIDASEYVTDLNAEGLSARLVIDVNGDELAILNSLRASSLLRFFSEVYVYTGMTPLFEDAGDRDTIIALLSAHGFAVQAKVGRGGFMASLRAIRDDASQFSEPTEATSVSSHSESFRGASSAIEDDSSLELATEPAFQDSGSEGLRGQLEGAQNQISKLLADSEAKEAQVLAEKRQLASAKGIITKLKKQLEVARKTLEDSVAEIEGVRAELSRSEAERCKLEAALADEGKQAEALRARVEDISREFSAEKAGLQAALADESKQVEALRARVEDISREFSAEKAGLQAALADEGKEVEALRARVEHISSESSTEKARLIAEHGEKLEGLRAETEERSQLVRELETRNSKFDGEFARVEAQLDLIKELLFHDKPE